MASAGAPSARSPDSLRLRLASAAVGIPLLFLVIWAGTLWVAIAAAVLCLLGLLELYRLAGALAWWPRRAPGMALGVLLVLAGGAWEASWMPLSLVALGSLVVLLAYLVSPRSTGPHAVVAAGPLYLGGALSYAVMLRELDSGAWWLALAVLSTFAVDTSAYFVGHAIGKHRMAPRISPRKTWEGAAAGFAGGLGATVLMAAVFPIPLMPWRAALLGAGVGVAAQVGDLLESALKRAAGAKESGQIIPGHGGMLDRLDSVVLVLVLVYHGATW